MAVVLGTNAGFVTVAPTTDPQSFSTGTDSSARVTKDTCPVQTKITEMGFYVSNSHNVAGYELGIYSHDGGGDTANALLFSTTGHTTDGSTGWQVVSGLDWELSEGVIYWLGFQVDNVAGSVDIDYAASGGRAGIRINQTSLPSTFSSISDNARILAVYAKVESATTFSEISGTIAAQSVVSGNIELSVWSNLSGTIAAATTVGPSSLGQVAVSLGESVIIQRLVAVGNNRLYYEDI